MWWTEHGFNAWSQIRVVLRAERGRDTAPQRRGAAIEGLAFATEHQPELGARLLALVAVQGVETERSAEETAEYLTWADRAVRPGAPRPSDALEWVVAELTRQGTVERWAAFLQDVRERMENAKAS